MTGRGNDRCERIPLVYLLAASHSGSTLLALLLGSHPDICTVGELKITCLRDLNDYRCGCGAPIRTCAFWSEIARRMNALGLPFNLDRSQTDYATDVGWLQRMLLAPLHRNPAFETLRDAALLASPGWRTHLARVQRANAALARTVLDLTRRRMIVDSSKIGVRLKYLLRNPAFDVKVIRLVRDGRAVALTYTDPATYADARNPLLRGGGHGRDRDAERLPMRLAAREWRRANEEAAEIVRRLAPGRTFSMRYEDLCADPDALLCRIWAFLGVSPIGRSDLALRAQERHVIGNGMRLDWDGGIRLDDRWRSAFGVDDLTTFDRVAGDLNRSLGYDASASACGGPAAFRAVLRP